MRRLTPLLFLMTSLHSEGQDRFHVEGGLTEATLNFNKNGAGGFMVPLRYDIIRLPHSSITVGSNPVLGTEDRYGVGFPLVIALLVGAGESGETVDPAVTGTSYGDTARKGTTVCLFAQAPLLLQYNWGLGSGNYDADRKDRFGFYVGVGMGLTLTGITNNADHEHSESFWGWMGTFGVRFAKDKDLGFDLTLPCENMIGPVSHPVMYQVHFCWDLKYRKPHPDMFPARQEYP